MRTQEYLHPTVCKLHNGLRYSNLTGGIQVGFGLIPEQVSASRQDARTHQSVNRCQFSEAFRNQRHFQNALLPMQIEVPAFFGDIRTHDVHQRLDRIIDGIALHATERRTTEQIARIAPGLIKTGLPGVVQGNKSGIDGHELA